MCGRYLLKSETVEEIVEKLDIKPIQSRFQLDEVYPSADCLVLTDPKNPEVKKWGLDKGWGQRTLINSRLETLQDELKGLRPKRFLDDFKYRRVLIPASGFFEWDKDKEKYLFKQDKPIFLAGISSYDTFSIITQAATTQTKDIHHRLPLIVSENDIDAYFNLEDMNKILIPKKDIVFDIKTQD